MGRSSIPPFPPPLEPRRALQKMTGIEQLMIAVVSTAFDDLQSADLRQRDTAIRYFFEDPETHVLSFPSVCRQMDWSASAVRQRLLQRFDAAMPASEPAPPLPTDPTSAVTSAGSPGPAGSPDSPDSMSATR